MWAYTPPRVQIPNSPHPPYPPVGIVWIPAGFFVPQSVLYAKLIPVSMPIREIAPEGHFRGYAKMRSKWRIKAVNQMWMRCTSSSAIYPRSSGVSGSIRRCQRRFAISCWNAVSFQRGFPRRLRMRFSSDTRRTYRHDRESYPSKCTTTSAKSSGAKDDIIR